PAAAVPVTGDAHLLAAIYHFDQNPFQQQANNRLALLLGRGGPDAGQISCQLANRRDFRRAQRRRLIAPNALVLCLEARLLGQSLLPWPFKGARNQPVLRLDGIELSAYPLGFVAGSFNPLPPVTLNR